MRGLKQRIAVLRTEHMRMAVRHTRREPKGRPAIRRYRRGDVGLTHPSVPRLQRLDRRRLDRVVLGQVDQVFDLLPGSHPFGLCNALELAGLPQFGEQLFLIMGVAADNHLRLDAGNVAHLVQLLAAVDRAAVPIAATLHVDKWQLALARRFLGILLVARQVSEQAMITKSRSLASRAFTAYSIFSTNSSAGMPCTT